MSTRATVHFCKGGKSIARVHVSHDGYPDGPEGVLAGLKAFFKGERSTDPNELVEAHMESIFRGKAPSSVDSRFNHSLAEYVALAGEGPHVCPGCGAPGFFGERPSAQDNERAKRTSEDPRALHWEVRGAFVCLECFNKEKR